MRTRLCLAEERRTARRAESPVHLVATVRDAWIVAGLASHRERCCTEAGVDRSATGTDILAFPAPAHAGDNRWRRAFPTNYPAEASTCYRHDMLQATKEGLDRGSYVGEYRAGNHAAMPATFGKVFELSVEPYRGSGGNWSPIGSDPRL